MIEIRLRATQEFLRVFIILGLIQGVADIAEALKELAESTQ